MQESVEDILNLVEALMRLTEDVPNLAEAIAKANGGYSVISQS